MLFVLTLGFIFIEEIEPCQFDTQGSQVRCMSVKIKIRATGDFNQFAARVIYLASLSDFSC